MSVVKRIIDDNIERVKVDELLAEEYDGAGYGGITLTKTPLGTQINLFTMRPGRVIGKRGRAIKAASTRLEEELGIPNPQITVVEVEIPELNPRIMASRIANALERGVHYRRALFWSLRRTMESGALGCEIVLKGKLRSDRGRYEKVSEGYIPKSGDPALKQVKSAVVHVKQKKGTFGVTVTIVPPDASFPDKVELDNLPEIEYPEEEIPLPEGIESETEEAEPTGSLEAEGKEPIKIEVEEKSQTDASSVVESEIPEQVTEEMGDDSSENADLKESLEAIIEPELNEVDDLKEPIEVPKAPEEETDELELVEPENTIDAEKAEAKKKELKVLTHSGKDSKAEIPEKPDDSTENGEG